MKKKTSIVVLGCIVLLFAFTILAIADGYEFHCKDFDPECADTSNDGCWAMRNQDCIIYCKGSDPMDCTDPLPI